MLAGVKRTPAGKFVGRGRPKDSSIHGEFSCQTILKEVGLSQPTAYRWQQLDLISKEDFEAFLAAFKIEVSQESW